MKILLIPNFTKPKTAFVLQRLISLLNMEKIRVLALRRDYDAFAEHGFPQIECLDESEEHPENRFDLICVIGGDGTLLKNAHLAAETGIPVTGVNTGKLGFLTQIEPGQLEGQVRAIIEKRYTIEERIALNLTWNHQKIDYVLNDVVFSGTDRSKLVYFTVTSNGRFVERYRADALIVSTPTGSTAYNYAAGGAVFEAGLKTISILPICAQLGLRIPLVFSSERKLAFTVSEPVHAICDGVICGTLEPGEAAIISASQQATPTLSFDDVQVFPGLRRKLNALADEEI